MFIKNLKILYDLAQRGLGRGKNKGKEKDDFLLPNSFIFSNNIDSGNYNIFNSVSDIIKEFKIDNIYMKHFTNIFISYFNICPDYSNYFISIAYNILETVLLPVNNKNKVEFGIEIKTYYISLLNKLKELVLKHVYIISLLTRGLNLLIKI